MQKKPILAIIDDDQSAREGMVELVNAGGFNAEAFESAADFLRSECASRADCLITDVRMPGMSGIALLDHLRASGRIIPTIMITSFAKDADRRHALAAGAICYLSKPFDSNDLLRLIQTALSSAP